MFAEETRILTMDFGPIEIGRLVGRTVTVVSGDGTPRSAKIERSRPVVVRPLSFRALGSGGKFRKTVRASEQLKWSLLGGDDGRVACGSVVPSIPPHGDLDADAVIHGLMFGDGSAHKRRLDHSIAGVSAGRSYASLRVCKTGHIGDEIHRILDEAGYPYSTPRHAGGNRVYYLGRFPFCKEVPHTNDPSYLAGFIHGWWLADGSKGVAPVIEISTSNEIAAAWLREHGGYCGLVTTMERLQQRRVGDGSFANGKALHVIRLRRNVEWKLEAIGEPSLEPICVVFEPVTGSFVLANGLGAPAQRYQIPPLRLRRPALASAALA